MRFLTKLLLGAAFAAMPSVANAQATRTVAPPSEAALDVVNLKTEWTTAVPLMGRFDTIGLIQVTNGNQLYVQTKTGLLLALDAKTGAQQWSLKYDAPNAPIHPVAVNDRYVVAVNLTTMYLLHRYSGLVEFQFKLPLVPSAAPTMDADTVYMTLNGQRVTAYALPDPIQMPEKLAKINTGPGSLAGAADLRIRNPADVVAQRYPNLSRNIPIAAAQFEEVKITVAPGASTGASGSQRSPSLSILPSVRPPYRSFDDRGKYIEKSESLSTVHSLRQPYTSKDPTGAQIQRTPSISSIPPSLAGILEKSSLLPRGLEPGTRWVVGSSIRLTHAPLTTNFRVWISGDSPLVQAILKEDKALQLTSRMPNAPAADAVQADDVAYFPLIDGNLLAIDMTSGGGKIAKVDWRANVGGAMNRKPLLTADAIYQGGDTSGVARISRKNGEVTWRTDETADTILALNDDVVYVRDKLGILRVYDRNRITDATTKRAVEIGALNLSGFTVPATNEQTDRLFMASDAGLLICLRDKGAKYATALSIAPPLHKVDPNVLKKPADAAAPMTPAAPGTPPAAPPK